MTANRLGGGEENARYVLLFVLGVLVGSLIRAVAFVVPTRVVRYLEGRLLPDAN